jgi:hypothetical protein
LIAKRCLSAGPSEGIGYNKNKSNSGVTTSMSENFQQQLDDLINKKIDEFTVTPETFQDFQSVFHDYEYRTQVVGKAERGGTIKYRLKES